jgi:glycosyltransferase involved in cell wall biosynthesis
MLDVLIVISSDPLYDSRSTKYFNSLLEAGLKTKLVGISADGTYEKNERVIRFPIKPSHGKRFFAQFYRNVIPETWNSPTRLIIAGDLFSLLPAVLNKLRFSRKGSAVKLIYDSKEFYEELPSLKLKRSSFLFWNSFEKSLVKFADSIITVNQSIADILIAKWHKPTNVIMNVPDTANLHKKRSSEKSFSKIYLTFSGGLQFGRGLNNILKILSLLPEKYQLRLIGDGELRDKLESRAASLNLSNRVEFVGKVKNTELLNEISKSHIGICLIENVGGSYHLSLPNKLFQYIAAGIPVVASNFPELSKIVDGNKVGVTVDPEDLQATAEKILEITADMSLYERLCENCIKTSEKFNWKIEKEKLLTLVKKLTQ